MPKNKVTNYNPDHFSEDAEYALLTAQTNVNRMIRIATSKLADMQVEVDTLTAALTAAQSAITALTTRVAALEAHNPH